jgi:hypothetical protein
MLRPESGAPRRQVALLAPRPRARLEFHAGLEQFCSMLLPKAEQQTWLDYSMCTRLKPNGQTL